MTKDKRQYRPDNEYATRVNVSMYPNDVAMAKLIGAGNISRGVRRALKNEFERINRKVNNLGEKPNDH